MAEADPGIPALVVRFIHDQLHSVEQLEVLLLLARRAPEALTAEQISAELRSTPASVMQRVEPLCAHGLLVRVAEDGRRYRFSDGPAAREAVQAVGEAYRVRPFRVMQLIANSQSPFLRDFSEAFRLKGKK